MYSHQINRASSSSGKTVGLCLGGVWFEPRSGHHLSGLRFFVIFPILRPRYLLSKLLLIYHSPVTLLSTINNLSHSKRLEMQRRIHSSERERERERQDLEELIICQILTNCFINGSDRKFSSIVFS